MQPQPPQPDPAAHPERLPVPGPVRGLAVVLWVSAAISLTVLVINMATAPAFGVEPGYAFGYSLPHTLIGVLLAVPAFPVIRGRSWARTMAKTVLIIQIVLQSLMLFSGTSAFWALFLLPLAIAGVVLLHRPLAQWFFAVHNQAANQGYVQQYAAHHPHQQVNRGYHPPQQYPQQAYQQQTYEQQAYGQQTHQQQAHEQQAYGQQAHEQQPPQNGAWSQDPRQQ